MMNPFSENQWALILGGSSGFGLATAKKLASQGMSVCVVHRDRQGAMTRIEQEFEKIRSYQNGFISLNLDALSPEGQERTLAVLCDKLGGSGKVRLLFHCIAYGNLKPIAPLLRTSAGQEDAIAKLAAALDLNAPAVSQAIQKLFQEGAPEFSPLIPTVYGETLMDDEDMARTIYSMGTNLLTWVQRLYSKTLFAEDARVLSLTSEGNEVAWRGYAAVSAAKAALEAVSRSIAVEFGPHGIRSNIIQAGITETPALRAIPGSDRMKAGARLRNPLKRLTLPEDVANVVCLLCTDEAAWINGALLRVDGGEHIASS